MQKESKQSLFGTGNARTNNPRTRMLTLMVFLTMIGLTGLLNFGNSTSTSANVSKKAPVLKTAATAAASQAVVTATTETAYVAVDTLVGGVAGSTLNVIDLTTGRLTPLGAIGPAAPLNVGTVRGLANPANVMVMTPGLTSMLAMDRNALFGLINNNSIICFSIASPGTVFARTAVTGLNPGESLVGIDFRPLDGLLYGITRNSLYTIDPMTGVATFLGTLVDSVSMLPLPLEGNNFGVDFNPTNNNLRVVSNTGQNLSISPVPVAMGMIAATVQTRLNGDSGSAIGAAYTHNENGATVTTLYDLNNVTGQGGALFIQNPPASGTLAFVNFLTDPAGARVNIGPNTAFDITDPNDLPQAVTGRAYRAQLTGVGGMAPYTFSLAMGMLPTGLTLSPAGLITGTPTQSGTFPLTFNVVDAMGMAGTFTATLISNLPLVNQSANAGYASLTGLNAMGQAVSSLYMVNLSSGRANFVGEFSRMDPMTMMAVPRVVNDIAFPLNFSSSLMMMAPVAAPEAAKSTTKATDQKAFTNLGPLSAGMAFGVDSANMLFTFNYRPMMMVPTLAPTTPTIMTTDIGPIMGLQSGEVVRGIDFRPASGQMYALGSTGRVYVLTVTPPDPLCTMMCTSTVTATLLTTTPVALSGTDFGFDFNPMPDRIRVVSNAGQDLRLNPDTGNLFATDPAINGAVGSAVASAYTQNFNGTPGTTLFNINSVASSLTIQNPANSGTQTPVGSLRLVFADSRDNSMSNIVGFDVANTLPDALFGESYNQTVTPFGGTAPYTFQLMGLLPQGLVFNQLTGTISGTPTPLAPGMPPAPAQNDFSIVATDANGAMNTTNYSIVSSCPSLALAPVTVNEVVGGVATITRLRAGITSTVTFAVNDSRAVTYSVVPNPMGTMLPMGAVASIPPGTMLNATTGVLTGVPAGGTYVFTINATDQFGCSTMRTYSVTLPCNQLIILNPANLPTATTGVPFNRQLTASGGAAPFTFTVVAGTLPTGITLNPNGLLSGTTTTAGTFNFTIRATDAAGLANPGACFGTQSYTLTVCSGAVNLGALPTTFRNGSIVSQTIVTTNSTAPVRFSVTAGSLPSGLSLSSAGVLSGTTRAAGLFTFTVTATDARGCTGSRTYTIRVS